uniref:Putative copper-transporting ATPase-like protein n=1 Tax=Trypanosoma congolense (strain IL3000) TaxID=1068625 RepID=G0UZB9_TRYCI|nr:putative copper-transporting ATPase-like protein [Trypanosoma congolense IL3000]
MCFFLLQIVFSSFFTFATVLRALFRWEYSNSELLLLNRRNPWREKPPVLRLLHICTHICVVSLLPEGKGGVPQIMNEENSGKRRRRRRRSKEMHEAEAHHVEEVDPLLCCEMQAPVSHLSEAGGGVCGETSSVPDASISGYDATAVRPEACEETQCEVQFLVEAESNPPTEVVKSCFVLKGLSCSSCAARIESHIGAMKGVSKISVNFATLDAIVLHNPRVTKSVDIVHEIEGIGYGAQLCMSPSEQAMQLDDVEPKEVEFLVSGMTCASCASRLESFLCGVAGVKGCDVSFSTGICKVFVEGGADTIARVEEGAAKLGYTMSLLNVGVRDAELGGLKGALEQTEEIRDHKHAFIMSAILAVPLALSMALMTCTDYFDSITNMTILNVVQICLTTPIVFCFGSCYFVSAWRDLKHRTFTMNTLIALGAGCTYIYSVIGFLEIIYFKRHAITYFDTAGMLLSFMLLGRYLETGAKRQTNDALIKLMNLVPPMSLVVTSAGDVSMPSTSIKKGMRVRVLAGDRIPVDGVVTEGFSDVDEQMVSGESLPRPVAPGKMVVGGTTNITSMMVVEATKVGEETVLSQLLRVIREAQGTKPAIQRIADRVASKFVPVVIVFSVLVLIVWVLLGVFDLYPRKWRGPGESVLVFAFDFFIATVVAACPCALGLATPTAIMVGTGVGARIGILVKSSVILERMRRTRCVVFDKTGTITTGNLWVVFERYWGNDSEADFGAIGVVLRQSTHPIARAFLNSILRKENVCVEGYDVLSSKTVGGLGTQAVAEHKRTGSKVQIVIGSSDMMRRCGVEVSEEVAKVEQWQMELGRTVSFAAVDGSLRVLISLADEVKDEAAGVVHFLQTRNIHVLLVTGDNHRAAAAVAEVVGIPAENVYANALPVTKASIVKELQKEYQDVVFVGDGINDGPALAQASVGVALGAGTEIAIEAADAVLMKNSLVDLLNLRALSITTVRHVYGNFFWAFAYNIIMLPLASGLLYPLVHVRIPPIASGVAMILSSLSVLLSSLSIRCFSPYTQQQFSTGH